MPDDRDELFTGLSDLTGKDLPSERDLANELFNKTGLKEKINAFERQLGIGVRRKDKPTRIRNCILAPGRKDDQEVLDRVLNDKRFQILMWKDTWTVHGDFRVFVVYLEEIDNKESNETQAS